MGNGLRLHGRLGRFCHARHDFSSDRRSGRIIVLSVIAAAFAYSAMTLTGVIVETAERAGMQAHIAKPVDVNVLMAALRSVLK